MLLYLYLHLRLGSFKHTQTLAKVVVTDAAPFEKSYVLGNFNAFGSMGFIIGWVSCSLAIIISLTEALP